MLKLEIINGSLQVSDGANIILVAPKEYCAINALSLYQDVPYIEIFNKYIGNNTNVFVQPLSLCVDSTDTEFTVNSFIAFAEANLGFYTGAGSGLFAQTEDSIPVTATDVESSLIGNGVGSLSIPPNYFSIGDSFNAFMEGGISCLSSSTLHIHVRTSNGVILSDTGIIDMNATTSKYWTLSLQFTVRAVGEAGVASISSGGIFSYIQNASNNFDAFVLSNINNTTFDTTISNTLLVTAQWNTNSASNSIFSRNFTLNKIY